MIEKPDDSFSVEVAVGELREKIDAQAEDTKTLIGMLEALQSSIDECLTKANGSETNEHSG